MSDHDKVCRIEQQLKNAGEDQRYGKQHDFTEQRSAAHVDMIFIRLQWRCFPVDGMSWLGFAVIYNANLVLQERSVANQVTFLFGMWCRKWNGKDHIAFRDKPRKRGEGLNALTQNSH